MKPFWNSATSVLICPRYMQFSILILAPIDTHFKRECIPVAFIENRQELVKLPGGCYSTSNPAFKSIYFTTPSPFSHKYLVSYHRYFESKLNEPIIENFEWGFNMQFREHCGRSVKTMFSQSITQNPPFWDNSYTYRCGFSMQTKRFYFHCQRVETGDDILQILKMVENPSKFTAFGKNSVRALSSASGCKALILYIDAWNTCKYIHENFLIFWVTSLCATGSLAEHNSLVTCLHTAAEIVEWRLRGPGNLQIVPWHQ